MKITISGEKLVQASSQRRNRTMSKINSREKIVVGVDAVKKYAQIANNHHEISDVSCAVSKQLFRHKDGEVRKEINIWCGTCIKHYDDLSSFLKAHGIEN